MGMFSSALASGQLGPLLSQFGLPTEAVDAANKGGETRTRTHTRDEKTKPATNVSCRYIKGLLVDVSSLPNVIF